MKVTEIQAFVLAALEMAGESYGHQLIKKVGEIKGSAPKIVTVYKALHALEFRKLVEGWWEEQPDEEFGRPRRRIYRVTDEGQRALRDFAATQAKVATALRSWTELGPSQ